ncbi:MAG: MaoC family dehydratase N-terminal domain-containing protein [Propionibacteriaceae bacterium]|mgnify:CR=1 FL=1|jgi:acyl dehydratase|nr:MaoC family dehydratase N-terminal domain-containing protein [Propionibacteriaceae bacterium]
MSVRELPELPSLVPLFAKAVLPSLDRGPARIPGDTVLVRGVGQDLGRLADYDRVCGFGLSEVVPPTWLHVLTFGLHIELLSGRDSTIRLAGVVHVSNRMRLHRPVVVTDRLDVSARATNLRPHKRGALLDIVGEVHVDGELVWDGVSTYLAPGAKVPGTDEQLAREEYVPTTPNAVWRLPADLGRQYRAVSGDPNPIHTSRLAARAFGFARPIIHGMWTHARLLAAVQPRLPDAYAVEVGFARPILLPGTVGAWWRPDAGGWVAAVTDRAGAKPYLTARITPSP